jgi:hypothetical protein
VACGVAEESSGLEGVRGRRDWLLALAQLTHCAPLFIFAVGAAAGAARVFGVGVDGSGPLHWKNSGGKVSGHCGGFGARGAKAGRDAHQGLHDHLPDTHPLFLTPNHLQAEGPGCLSGAADVHFYWVAGSGQELGRALPACLDCGHGGC